MSPKRTLIAPLMWCSLFLLTSLLVGCRAEEDRLFPLRGKVLYKGKPIPSAEIVFHPLFEGPGWMPVATVAGDGTFEAGTKQPGDGALAGRYRVTITWYPNATDENQGRNFLPKCYSDGKTSPLEVEVNPESDHFHLLHMEQ